MVKDVIKLWFLRGDYSGGPEHHHVYPYIRKPEGDSRQTHRGQGNMKTELQRIMWPHAKGGQQPPEAGRGKEGTDSPHRASTGREWDLADTLISYFCPSEM